VIRGSDRGQADHAPSAQLATIASDTVQTRTSPRGAAYERLERMTGIEPA